VKLRGAKFSVFLKHSKIYIAAMSKKSKNLYEQFCGSQERALSGESCLINMANGIVYLVDLMIGQRNKFGQNYLNFAKMILIWNS
jgi:hypothetical protein